MRKIQIKRRIRVCFRVRGRRGTQLKYATQHNPTGLEANSSDWESCSESEAERLRSQVNSTDFQPAKTEVDPFQYLEESSEDNRRGELCEMHCYDARENSKGETIILRTGTKYDMEDEEERSPDAALVLTRYIENGETWLYELNIQSPYIKKALQEVVGSYPGINIETDSTITLHGEPRCLFHYRKELKEYAEASQDDCMREHVGFSLRYMNRALRKEILTFENMMEGNEEAPGLDFENLWVAFKPGTLVYLKTFDGLDSIEKFISMSKREDMTGTQTWKLVLSSLKYDGVGFGYTRTESTIKHYSGYKPLTDLEVFPFKFHGDHESIRGRLLSRGRKYMTLHGCHYRMYNNEPRQESSTVNGSGTTARERIMVDANEYYKHVGVPPHMTTYNSKPTFEAGTRIKISDDKTPQVADEDLLACYYRVTGFSFRTRKWEPFVVDYIEDIQYNSRAFDALCISKAKKDMIVALARSGTKSATKFDDIIEGKGKGIVFLLHGPPGVGKTFTAESLVEFLQRPLYTISCSTSSSIAQILEMQLTDALSLAARWNAIVLIDEADVYMAERDLKNLTRNELVSVLLRVVEYFEGIMFLTTNRAKTIDSAFKSRIHLSIAYPDLSEDSRRELWKIFIKQGSDQKQPVWFDDSFLSQVVKPEINGRQIKNAVRVAYALAQDKGRELHGEDIILVLKALSSFEGDFSGKIKKRGLLDAVMTYWRHWLGDY